MRIGYPTRKSKVRPASRRKPERSCAMPPIRMLLPLLLVVPMLRATEVEESKVIHAKGLGTATYTATDAEKPFLQKASPKTFNPDEEMTKAVLEVRAGTYISWFGIVREISRIPDSAKQRVVVESKCFNGLGDRQRQAPARGPPWIRSPFNNKPERNHYHETHAE